MYFEVKNSDIEVFESDSSDFPYHIHTHAEILICTAGTFGVSCNNQERLLHVNDAMISFPNEIHSYKKTEYGKGIIIIFNPAISELFANTLNIEQYDNFVHAENISSLSAELLQHFKVASNSYMIYGYLHIILGMILKKPQHKKPVISVNAFNDAIRYISDHYTKPLTLKKLSAAIGVSEAHLSRVFSEKIDGGFNKYIKLLRTEKAKTLLETTDLSIGEIIFESGFSDQRTFNRVFKHMTNMTPREYKQSHSILADKTNL